MIVKQPIEEKDTSLIPKKEKKRKEKNNKDKSMDKVLDALGICDQCGWNRKPHPKTGQPSCSRNQFECSTDERVNRSSESWATSSVGKA